ncbi:MAG: hypothetical protein IPL53_07525 [Ignavibacteria bacterium]|nr:hypothetical protein [Ignavibacteria bacterium]
MNFPNSINLKIDDLFGKDGAKMFQERIKTMYLSETTRILKNRLRILHPNSAMKIFLF